MEAYNYFDETGKLLLQSCRHFPKTFRLRKPDGQGGWEHSIKDVEPVPYNLPDVIKAEVVFIPEGEKDCNTLKSQGVTASCNPMGPTLGPDLDQWTLYRFGPRNGKPKFKVASRW